MSHKELIDSIVSAALVSEELQKAHKPKHVLSAENAEQLIAKTRSICREVDKKLERDPNKDSEHLKRTIQWEQLKPRLLQLCETLPRSKRTTPLQQACHTVVVSAVPQQIQTQMSTNNVVDDAVQLELKTQYKQLASELQELHCLQNLIHETLIRDGERIDTIHEHVASANADANKALKELECTSRYKLKGLGMGLFGG
eukprot:PhF_6_TR29165/c0_g1_i1/m.42640